MHSSIFRISFGHSGKVDKLIRLNQKIIRPKQSLFFPGCCASGIYVYIYGFRFNNFHDLYLMM